MLEVLPDLYVVSANERAGFGYSHFLKRTTGNILLPRAKAVSLSDQFEALEALGGVDWVLLSDRHFAGPGCREAADRFEAPLVASTIEAKAFAKRCPVDVAVDLVEGDVADGIRAVPTPGHTPGQIAYRVEGDHAVFLFVGDLAYRKGGQWHVGNQRRSVMTNAMTGLHDLSFDFFIGCAGYDDADSFVAAESIATLVEPILAACSR